jgi:hypothetical protein
MAAFATEGVAAMDLIRKRPADTRAEDARKLP